MAPIALKQSASSAQALTGGGAPDARGLVRDAVCATLASPPLGSHPPLPQRQADWSQAEIRFGPPVDGLALDAVPAPRVLCCEEIDGRRWSYVVDDGGHPGRARRGSAVRAVAMQSPMAPLEDGAGRVGKMLFARQGKKFDYDLKQVSSCAGVELATAAVPHLFLPLACAANVVKVEETNSCSQFLAST
ncbi:hypothetical protein BHM03_00049155 [Ensete ventricosum]|uniref:Uncharacterized protein n=1 Tax=Ensete ventricosum TaxID=4639 RepID=A0A445MLD4_ENSVE|nr:hypothetical protein BHM03_00049155 [Ensete ventricosum]